MEASVIECQTHISAGLAYNSSRPPWRPFITMTAFVTKQNRSIARTDSSDFVFYDDWTATYHPVQFNNAIFNLHPIPTVAEWGFCLPFPHAQKWRVEQSKQRAQHNGKACPCVCGGTSITTLPSSSSCTTCAFIYRGFLLLLLITRAAQFPRWVEPTLWTIQVDFAKDSLSFSPVQKIVYKNFTCPVYWAEFVWCPTTTSLLHCKILLSLLPSVHRQSSNRST